MTSLITLAFMVIVLLIAVSISLHTQQLWTENAPHPGCKRDDKEHHHG
ncbi:hypothetical protein PO002_05150 [Cupriavidus necator]